MNEDEQIVWGQPVSFQDFVQGFQVTPNQRRVKLVPKIDPKNNGIPRPITTGGAGYIPSNYGQGLIDIIRRKLYDNINPKGYGNIIPRIKRALVDNKSEGINLERDDMWATYLSIPENERHQNVNKLHKSIYTPTQGTSFNDVYSVDLNDYEKSSLISETRDLPIGKNKLSYIFGSKFGDHTVGKGYDKNKGEYVSYYDRYDVNPFFGYMTEKDTTNLFQILSKIKQ